MGANGESMALDVRVLRALYRSDDKGFAVLACRTLDIGDAEKDGRLIAVGKVIGALDEGATVRLLGKFEPDPKGRGERFAVSRIEREILTDEGLASVLAGLVKGVGVKRALGFIQSFGGAETAARVLTSAESIGVDHDVPGLTQAMVNSLALAYRARATSLRAEAELRSLGLPHGQAMRIIAKYGDAGKAVDIAKTDPYRLSLEVDGIGFMASDALAKKLGVSGESRVRAAVLAALEEGAVTQGDTVLDDVELRRRCESLLKAAVQPAAMGVALVTLARESRVVNVSSDPWELSTAVMLARLNEAERVIADRIRGNCPIWSDIGSPSWYIGSEHTLDDSQRAAVSAMVNARTAVMTGGPGTGKSWTCKALVKVLADRGASFLLCAPTGRAARRLSDATGRDAVTIHRGLEWGRAMANAAGKSIVTTSDRSGPQRTADNPLDVDVCLVDEASMVDVELMAMLIRALPSRAQLFLVGDEDQLPPVGPGAPLRDVIASGKVPVCRLTTVHRQAAGSAVTMAAHAIAAGRIPEDDKREGLDGRFVFVRQGDPEKALRTAVEMAKRVEAKWLRCAVLAPVRKGGCGVQALNAALAVAMNANRIGDGADGRNAIAKGRGGCELVKGDRAMIIKNSYDLDVRNGDLCDVVAVGQEAAEMIGPGGEATAILLKLGVDGRLLPLDAEAAREMVELAWCSTVHKYQGSEAPAVVIVLSDEHAFLLSRPLIYTAVTRAAKFCAVVGSEKAMRRAVSNARGRPRRTTLVGRITEGEKNG